MRRLNYRYYSWPGTDWMSAFFFFFFTRQELGKPANLAGAYDITAAAIYKEPVGSPTPLGWYLAEGLCHETSQWHFGSALGTCIAIWSQQHCITYDNEKRRKDFFFLNLCELVSSYGTLPVASIHGSRPKLRALWWLLADVYSGAYSTSTHAASLSFQELIMTKNSSFPCHGK